MKKLFFLISVIISSSAFGQDLGIKLQSVQTFTVIPAHTQNADSIAIISIDRAYTGTVQGVKEGSVTAVIQFWNNGKPKELMTLPLWNTFQGYADVTDQKVINRVKNKLNIP